MDALIEVARDTGFTTHSLVSKKGSLCKMNLLLILAILIDINGCSGRLLLHNFEKIVFCVNKWSIVEIKSFRHATNGLKASHCMNLFSSS
jgi:hypothetical protein